MSGPTEERQIEGELERKVETATSRRSFLLAGAASALTLESAAAQPAPAPQGGSSAPPRV
jgi:hypothetical protein